VRYVVAIVGLLAIVGGLVGVKYKQISSMIQMGKEMQKAGPPPETVGSAVSQDQKWETTLSAVGSISPAKGVTIGNEIAGIVSSIKFDSGAIVKPGQVLIELDTSVERAQLASAVARKELAVVNATRSRQLIQHEAIAQSQVDTDESGLKSAAADVASLQAQIERKTIRAPFAGRLGIRQVNLGQYLNPGTAITVLQAVDNGYVDFTLPQQRLPDVAVGMPVRILLDAATKPLEGTVAAIDPTLDSTTRTIKLRATVPNTDTLRPGMFVTVSVILPQSANRVTVPATAVVHASFGNSVFIIEDKKDQSGAAVNGPDGKPLKVARQQFVRLGESRGDFVAVLDGVKPGQEVVSSGAFKLRNGAGVVVNNEVKQNPQLAPKVENH